MKKRVGLLLIVITICFLSMSCNKTATIDNHIFETDLKSDSGYTWKSLRMDNEYIDNIECLVDDNIVYSKYENGDTNLVFYNYNITDKQTYRLGSIKDPYINSGDVVVVGNKVFFYCNRVVGTEKYPDGKLENSLYKINVGDHKLQKIASDSTDQTLIYVKVCKDKIISLKGKKNKKKSMPVSEIKKFTARNLSDEEKEKLIKELQAKTDDPDVKAEIRKLVENGEWDKL